MSAPNFQSSLGGSFSQGAAGFIPWPTGYAVPERAGIVVNATSIGLGMLVNQGVISIKYWTGIDADPAVMRKTVAEIFGG